ncbi:MAG: hypothetical protein HOM68_22225 [Gemmatimonadetes bacterium]|jgi:hypothetical protein|nr:hypothetical protein [Gemmatimonadota bacterium]MBT5059276.1 hypothetical protein [Gemmatimonadota bacterium]MBT5145526.1 hypothetical protein [Gemmatimonadota bacterium]MBT5591714.1 hypothetical protein [Gemmatimonadota bacterium]MBT5961831.1 hypothetical protein [Gemmatimonadota bacterium]
MHKQGSLDEIFDEFAAILFTTDVPGNSNWLSVAALDPPTRTHEYDPHRF